MSRLPDSAYDWALVDAQTSGLIARRDRIPSIAVPALGPDGSRTGEYSTLVNPGCESRPRAIHALTAERLRGAPSFEQAAGRIGAFRQDRWWRTTRSSTTTSLPVNSPAPGSASP